MLGCSGGYSDSIEIPVEIPFLPRPRISADILSSAEMPFLLVSRISAWNDHPRQIDETADRSCTEVTLKKKTQNSSRQKMNTCRDSRGYKKVTAFPPRDIKYKQDKQLFGLRDKPITKQDALPRSEYQPRYLPGQDPLSLLRHPLCHPVLVVCRSPCIDKVEH
ncbi:hypothetical protein V6N11_076752 [Hibiscus sabdariffa]|uniref:Uncharacterized protein n=1 Tax=Hibiscus sabdariffa TaxID=183260 RepID=A0ABR2P9F5_9ROSI